MLNFILIFIAITTFFLLERFLKLNEGKRNFWFVLLPVTLLSSSLVGFRPLDAGSDTVKYIAYYNSLQNQTFATFFEKYSYNWESDYLYRIWNFCTSSLGVEPQYFLFFTAVISIFLFIISLRKLVGEDYLLIFLFFYAFPGFVQLFGNAIRQGMALSFFLFAIAYFYERKRMKLLLSVFATVFFHSPTGLILIITLLIIRIFSRVLKKQRRLLFFILLFIQPFLFFFADLVNRIYPSVYTTFKSLDYFFHYSFIIFLFLYLIYRIKYRLKLEKEEFMFTAYVVITLIATLVWFNPITFGRIVYLSFPFLALYINNLKYLYKQNWMVFLLILVVFGVGVYFFNTDSTRSMLSL